MKTKYQGVVTISSPDAGELTHWLEMAWVNPASISLVIDQFRSQPDRLCWFLDRFVSVERTKVRRRWHYRISWEWDRLPPWRGGDPLPAEAAERRKPLPGQTSFLESRGRKS